jgi:hypothetical protein
MCGKFYKSYCIRKLLKQFRYPYLNQFWTNFHPKTRSFNDYIEYCFLKAVIGYKFDKIWFCP